MTARNDELADPMADRKPPTTVEPSVSPTIPNWSREHKRFFQWCPSRSLLSSIRRYQDRSGNRVIGYFRRVLSVICHRFWSMVTGADIPLNCQIGGGLLIPHPNGIVISPSSRIGPNCLIFQQVTLGHAHDGEPTLGGHVDVGAGAKILGRIQIGDHALIGANAVVLHDVPPHATAVGIPAKIVVRRPSIENRRKTGCQNLSS